jgi:hypothetical protein
MDMVFEKDYHHYCGIAFKRKAKTGSITGKTKGALLWDMKKHCISQK